MDTMKKLIELSDHPWIQERWKPIQGDRFAVNGKKVGILYEGEYKVSGTNHLCGKEYTPNGWRTVCYEELVGKNLIYLPLGFNSETGNWQVDDLILELGKTCPIGELAYCFWGWKRDKLGLDRNQNDLVLKLIWLRELIDNQTKEGA